MRKAFLWMILLLTLCFGLVTWLQPRHDVRLDKLEPAGSTLANLLGDGRQMVADYFNTEADVYFHSGYYPSIFDQARQQEESDADVMHPGEGESNQEEKGFMGEPLDWIERFHRHFVPTVHTHLQGAKIREILPWLKLSAELDPHNVRTYIITDYWLRKRLGKSEEAEDFIRDGLKNNPDSPYLLYALGQIYLQDRKDYPRAKNLFTAAWHRWDLVEKPKPTKTESGEGVRDTLLLEQILGGLAEEETAAGRPDGTLYYLEVLKTNASDPVGVQQQIDKLKTSMAARKKPPTN